MDQDSSAEWSEGPCAALGGEEDELDIDAHTCVYTCFEITVFMRIKTVEHAFSTECAVRALLSKRFSGVVSR